MIWIVEEDLFASLVFIASETELVGVSFDATVAFALIEKAKLGGGTIASRSLDEGWPAQRVPKCISMQAVRNGRNEYVACRSQVDVVSIDICAVRPRTSRGRHHRRRRRRPASVDAVRGHHRRRRRPRPSLDEHQQVSHRSKVATFTILDPPSPYNKNTLQFSFRATPTWKIHSSLGDCCWSKSLMGESSLSLT